MLCEAFKIDRPTVMVALLGASAALAGLLVVFQGFLISAYTEIRTGNVKVKKRYKRRVFVVVGMVLLELLVAVCSTLALVRASILGIEVFWIAVVGFLAALVLVAAVSIAVAFLTLE